MLSYKNTLILLENALWGNQYQSVCLWVVWSVRVYCLRLDICVSLCMTAWAEASEAIGVINSASVVFVIDLESTLGVKMNDSYQLTWIQRNACVYVCVSAFCPISKSSRPTTKRNTAQKRRHSRGSVVMKAAPSTEFSIYLVCVP